MSNLLRNIVRINAIKGLTLPQTMGIRAGTRSLWHISKSITPITMKKKCNGIVGCDCGCGARFASTDGEKALVEFLDEEIASEKEASAGHLPSEIDGFKIKFDSAEVELTNQSAAEKIVIKFNINHTVDSDESIQYEDEQDQPESQAEKLPLRSKPTFEVDIVKNDTTLSLSCMFLGGQAAQGEYDDVFGIQEILIYKGEHDDKVYSCAGDVLDGYFYDLFMNLLAEKGITDEFVVKLSELATQYEQKLFVNLLEETKKFFNTK